MKREIAVLWRVTFVEYVRSSGGRVRENAEPSADPIAFFPETTHADADVWANPVFVREGMKHAGGCQSDLAPNENCGPPQTLHLYIRARDGSAKIQKGGKNNGSQGKDQSQTDELRSHPHRHRR